MLITQQLLDELTAKAKESPRLRTAFDLRTTPNDNSQRILNAVETGTILPIHLSSCSLTTPKHHQPQQH